jgi:hypothetical protein
VTRKKLRRLKAVREMMAQHGFTTLDAIEFISMHGISLTRGAALNRVVFACRTFLEETRVGTVQGEITAVCECCAEEWFPTKEELTKGRRTRGLVCPDCGEKDRYKLHNLDAYLKEGR